MVEDDLFEATPGTPGGRISLRAHLRVAPEEEEVTRARWGSTMWLLWQVVSKVVS